MKIPQIFLVLILILLQFPLYALPSDSDSITVRGALQSLEREFKGIKSISSDFIQTKKMSMFNRSIVLKGRLAIKFPHYFRWEVDEPVKTTVTAEGDFIKIWDEESGETQTTSTKNNPVVKNIWAQIDSWFMGKYAVLAKDYNISSVENKIPGGLPLLIFKPKSKPLSSVIESVILNFDEPTADTSGRKYLKRVIIEEKSGDSTIIDFSKVKIVLQAEQ
jgi:outer membrane lipoprotein carrier protein